MLLGWCLEPGGSCHVQGPPQQGDRGFLLYSNGCSVGGLEGPASQRAPRQAACQERLSLGTCTRFSLMARPSDCTGSAPCALSVPGVAGGVVHGASPRKPRPQGSPPPPSAGRTSRPPTSSAAQLRLRPEGPLPHRAVHAEPVPREPPSVEALTTLRLQAAPSSLKSRGTSLRR